MSAKNAEFDSLVAGIEVAYRDLGHTRDWRFLCGPRTTLSKSPAVALVTANPGGGHHTAGHGRESCESGSAYITEQWGAAPGTHNLQRQIRALFGLIAEKLGDGVSGDDLLNQSLTAYYIPFRSPRLSELVNAKRSIAFAEEMWATILANHIPKLIVTIDHTAFRGISAAIAKNQGRLVGVETYATGWGNISATKHHYQLADEQQTALLRLPHLSTFKLFSRPECSSKLDQIIGASVAHL